MDYFFWTPKLSVGVDMIDDEHKQWIAYINALHAGIEEGKDHEILEKLLDDVIAFSREHFEHEEGLFMETNYPDIKHHKELHDDYLKELEILKQRASQEKGAPLTLDVMLSIKAWFVDHVQEVDSQLAPYISSKPKE